MTIDDVEDLDPIAAIMAAGREIVDAAIGRVLANPAFAAMTKTELAALFRTLAMRTRADPARGAIFEGLAVLAETEKPGARDGAVGVEDEQVGVPELAVAEVAEAQHVAMRGLIDELAEAGLIRPERLAARWNAAGREMINGGTELRAAILVAHAAALLERHGQEQRPTPDPFDASHTLARVNELTADAVARFGLVAQNSMLTGPELRAWLFELADSARHSGRQARAAILETLAGMT